MFAAHGFPPSEVRSILAIMQQEMLAAFDECLDNLRPRNEWGFGAATATATTAMRTWFGATTPAALETVRKGVTQLRMVMKNVTIPVNWVPDGDFQGVTHVQAGFMAGMVLGSEEQRVRAMGSVTSTNYSISLSNHWMRMPSYAMGLPSAWTGGDKFECLVHELSHAVLGTVDVASAGGRVAYGGNLCRALATGNSVRALTNADSWGFFVEEFHAFRPDTRGRR